MQSRSRKRRYSQGRPTAGRVLLYSERCSITINSKDPNLAYELNLMHNTCAVSFWHLGEREGSRRRLSWTEGWEEDRKARFRILQAAASEAEEP
jgi:hypothetical protein